MKIIVAIAAAVTLAAGPAFAQSTTTEIEPASIATAGPNVTFDLENTTPTGAGSLVGWSGEEATAGETVLREDLTFSL